MFSIFHGVLNLQYIIVTFVILFVYRGEKRPGKDKKLTIYKDFCASLEAVFLTQGSIPNRASEGGRIVIFGWHHIQYGSGGFVFILSTKNSGIQHL